MQLAGKITEDDLNEVRKMVRSKMYWPKFILVNWYGIVLLGFVLWATISGAVGSTKPNWLAVGIIWLVIAAISGWAFYRGKSVSRREYTQLNAGLADWVTFGSDGLTFDGPSGAKSFQPWGTFKGWRSGQRVFLLDRLQEGFVILPVADISEPQRQTLRQLLDSHFPPIGGLG